MPRPISSFDSPRKSERSFASIALTKALGVPVPRNISFALTTPQILDRSKTVTRRLGWDNLRAGELLMACEKCQGLAPGTSPRRLGLIRVVSVRRELLALLYCDPAYGADEARKEGFPEMTGKQFFEHFTSSLKCNPDATVNRIEFEYVDEHPPRAAGSIAHANDRRQTRKPPR